MWFTLIFARIICQFGRKIHYEYSRHFLCCLSQLVGADKVSLNWTAVRDRKLAGDLGRGVARILKLVLNACWVGDLDKLSKRNSSTKQGWNHPPPSRSPNPKTLWPRAPFFSRLPVDLNKSGVPWSKFRGKWKQPPKRQDLLWPSKPSL